MIVIQQVRFEVDGSYLGHPFVTGRGLYNAVARRVDERTRRALYVSHGVFVSGESGEYPTGHSDSRYAGELGQSLLSVEAYNDLFVFCGAAMLFEIGLLAKITDADNTRHTSRQQQDQQVRNT